MFDAMKLLGTLLESQAAPSAADRMGAAAQSGSLQDILGQVLGGGGGANAGQQADGQPYAEQEAPAPGGGMAGGMAGGLGGLLGGLLGGASPGQGGLGQRGLGQGGLGQGGGGLADILGGLAGAFTGGAGGGRPAGMDQAGGGQAGGGLGSLAGALLGGGRGAAGGGMMAILAGLAASALQNRGGGQAAAGQFQAAMPDRPAVEKGSSKMAAHAPIQASIQALADPAQAQHRATLILRSMIQAAKADGQIDQQEMQRIGGKLDEAGESREARDFVMREMGGPADINALCQAVGSEQEAVEVYAAALMAIEVDTQAEQAYVAELANALGLDAQMVAHIHQTLGLRV